MKGVKDERAKNFHFDCFVVKGIIYTIGGSLTGNNDFVRTVEAYDPTTDKWTKKNDMPDTRVLSAACVLGNLIYMVDGFSGLNSLSLYEPATDTWKALTTAYSRRWEHTANVVNGKIYAIGGYSSSGTDPLKLVEEYDPFRAPKRPSLDTDAKKLATLWGKIKSTN